MFKTIIRLFYKPVQRRPDRMKMIRETEQDLNAKLPHVHNPRLCVICRQRQSRICRKSDRRQAPARFPPDTNPNLRPN